MKYKIKYKQFTINEPGVTVSNADVAYNTVKEDFSPIQEVVSLICVDTSNNVLKKHVLFKGAIASSMLDVATVFRFALLSGASSIIIAHNHPSGCLEPSGHDFKATEQIKNAAKIIGINFLDHIVYNMNTYRSIRNSKPYLFN